MQAQRIGDREEFKRLLVDLHLYLKTLNSGELTDIVGPSISKKTETHSGSPPASSTSTPNVTISPTPAAYLKKCLNETQTVIQNDLCTNWMEIPHDPGGNLL